MYLTPADLQARFGDMVLTLVGEDLETSVQVARALEDAQAEVDTYLQGRFSLPLQAVPPILKQVTADIVLYRLMPLRPEHEVEDVRARYRDAVKRLQDIRDGRLDLGLPQADAPSSGPAPVLVTSCPRLFSREQLRDA